MFARISNKIAELDKLQSINDILSKMYIVEDDTLYCVIATPNASKKEALGEVITTGETVVDCILDTDHIQCQNKSYTGEHSRYHDLNTQIKIIKNEIVSIFAVEKNNKGQRVQTEIAKRYWTEEGISWELF